jgi:hypothetical protein
VDGIKAGVYISVPDDCVRAPESLAKRNQWNSFSSYFDDRATPTD